MKHIGIKLADGSFYPILEEGKPEKKLLDLTTVQDNQTTVQIDLYRSENNSMEDAEYVDTLEIKNLKPHPNGEPDLNLNISINENNELNAEVADLETGKSSETQVSLVSRTLAERNAAPVNFAIDDKAAVEEDIKEPNFDNTIANDIATPTEDIDVPVALDSENEPDAQNSISDDDFAALEKTDNELNTEEKSADNVSEDKEVIDSPNNEDFSFDDLTINVPDDKKEKKDEKSEAVVEKTQPEDSKTNLDDFSKAVTEDTMPQEKIEEPSETLPDLSDFETHDDSVISDKKEEAADSPLPDFSDISIPDTDENTTAKTENTIEEKSASDETKKLFNENDYTVPDFDEPKATPIPTGLNNYFEDPTFSEPDFNDAKLDDSSIDETAEKQPEEVTSSKDPTYNPQNDISTDDLYDKETLDGNSNNDSDDVSKKTKKPVIICVVCAIICIIATLLVLFVIPSKFNLIKSRNTKNVAVEPPAVEEPEVQEEAPAPVEEIPEEPVEPEPVAPAAEDEVVVSPTPEVVPEVPAAPAEKPADIQYKIKWGDTLWDIADAYYKNPWRYHKLAKYNHIKNPDLIISGTYLLIPAE